MTAPAKGVRRYTRRGDSTNQTVSQLAVLVVDRKTSSAIPEQSLLLQVSETFSQENALSSLLHQAVAAIVKKLAATGAYLCLHCQEEDVLRLEAFCRQRGPEPTESSSDPAVSLSRTVKPGPLWRKVVRRPNPLLITNATNDRRVPFRDLLSAPHLLLVPLVSGSEVLGLIGIMVSDVNICTPEQVDLVPALALPAVVAAKLTRIIDRARQSAVLQERSRIAQDLHDTLGRGFTGVLMHMELAEETLFQDQQKVLRHILGARRMAREGMEEAHRAVFAVRPKALVKQRLAEALQQLAAELTRDTRIRTTFSLCGAPPLLAPQVELQLLRIAQEALTNILRHAAATTAHIELVSERHSVELNIQDDGHGVKRSASRRTSGLGLLGMTKRARQIGGRLMILPKPSRGTEIQVKVPLKRKSSAPEEYA